MLKNKNIWRNLFLVPCDGDSGAGGGGAAGGDAGAGAGTGAGAGAGTGTGAGTGAGTTDLEKKFTQADFNKHEAQLKEKTRQQNQALIQQLEQLKGIQNISEQQKAELQARIDDLTNQSLTKDEIAKNEKKRLQDEYDNKLKISEDTSKKWKSQFENQLTGTAILQAATSEKAFRPAQIEAFLRPHTKVVEVVENGTPTGRYEPRVTLQDIDEKGKVKTLDFTVLEAVKFMKTKDDYANLFIDEGTGGVGGGPSRDSNSKKDQNMEQLAKGGMDNYMEWRKKQQS